MLPPVFQFLDDRRIIYNSYIQNHSLPIRYADRIKLLKINTEVRHSMRREKSLPITVQDKEVVSFSKPQTTKSKQINSEGLELQDGSFPYSHHANVPVENSSIIGGLGFNAIQETFDYANLPNLDIRQDIKERLKKFDEGNIEPVQLKVVPDTEKSSTEDPSMRYQQNEQDSDRSDGSYGTADSSVPASDVPCGGCGALLHCQDPALPGNS